MDEIREELQKARTNSQQSAEASTLMAAVAENMSHDIDELNDNLEKYSRRSFWTSIALIFLSFALLAVSAIQAYTAVSG